MDTHSHHPEDLNALERRLSAWRPSHEGLNADAVLFAAGRASALSGPARYAWPALTAMLTVLVVFLGLRLIFERNERQALAQLLREHRQAPRLTPAPSPAANAAAEESPVSNEPPPDSYLASRRAMEKGMDAWPVRLVVQTGPPGASDTNPPIWRLGQRDALLDP